MAGNLSEWFVIALTYHCLCVGDRRGRFGRSYRCSSFGGRCTYIHHLFQRMLLRCGVWSAYGYLIARASWTERLYVWEARGFTSSSLLHLHKSLFVPFCPLFCSIPGSGYVSLILWLSMCFLCAYMCLCGAVWLLSLFLSGMMVEWWQDSRAVGEDRGPHCNCEQVRAEATYRDILVQPNLSRRFQPSSCFIVEQCIMVFPCLFINIWIGIMATGWQLRPVPSRVWIRIAAVEHPPPWPNVRKCCSIFFFYGGH